MTVCRKKTKLGKKLIKKIKSLNIDQKNNKYSIENCQSNSDAIGIMISCLVKNLVTSYCQRQDDRWYVIRKLRFKESPMKIFEQLPPDTINTIVFSRSIKSAYPTLSSKYNFYRGPSLRAHFEVLQRLLHYFMQIFKSIKKIIQRLINVDAKYSQKLRDNRMKLVHEMFKYRGENISYMQKYQKKTMDSCIQHVNFPDSETLYNQERNKSLFSFFKRHFQRKDMYLDFENENYSYESDMSDL